MIAPSGREWNLPTRCIQVVGGVDFFVVPVRDATFVRLVCDGVFSTEQSDDIGKCPSSLANTAGYKKLQTARNEGCLKPNGQMLADVRRRAIASVLELGGNDSDEPSSAKRPRKGVSAGTRYIKKQLVDESSFTVDLEGFGDIKFKTPTNTSPFASLVVLADEQQLQRLISVLQEDITMDAIKPRDYRPRDSAEDELGDAYVSEDCDDGEE